MLSRRGDIFDIEIYANNEKKAEFLGCIIEEQIEREFYYEFRLCFLDRGD